MNLEKILQNDKRIWDEEILDYPQLFELARTYDKELLGTLFNNKDSKEKFFIQVGDSHVFKYNEFRFYLEENQVNNSFTQYANKIGLSSQGEHLSDSTDYVLDWPYKDCVLEGGMSSEEDMDTFIEKKVETTPGKIDKKTGTVISLEKTEVTFSKAKRKREEIFYNNIIADKEIDRLLDKKALKNFTRYTAKGEEKVKEIKRDEDGTIKENLLIKGNNLLALHSLKAQFAGKVKLIYIDPPYNTGNDGFVYNDRFNHSTWLTFMKNRLEIAKEFLREDGIAMISCDDNEQAYLKVLMDTIFGRENFISNVAVVTNLAGNNDKFGFSGTHEYLLVYARNKSILTMNELSIDDDSLEEWSLDEIGYWKKGSSLQMTGEASNREDRPNLYYPIYVSKDGERVSTVKKNGWDIVYPKSGNVDKRWRWSKNRLEEQKDEVLISGTSPDWKLYKKQRPQFGELPTKRPKSVMYKPSYSYSYSAKELKDLFGKKVFSYSKSTELLSDFIEISTDEGDIIMDFFSGSGTTGSSILKLSEMKNSNRQFILVEQLSKDSNIGLERLSLEIKKFTYKNSFIYFELAEYNEEAKNKIDACTSFKELKKLFTELTEYYFLNYNVSVKQFNDQILDDKDFQEQPLEEQKTLFKALLDNNQLYIPHKEQEDGKYNLSKEDQELTNEFYG